MDLSGPKVQSEEPQDKGLEKVIPPYDFNVPITIYKFDDPNQRIIFYVYGGKIVGSEFVGSISSLDLGPSSIMLKVDMSLPDSVLEL